MYKKLLGIFVCMLLIASVLPVMGNIKSSYIPEKNESYIYLDSKKAEEIQYIIIDTDRESNANKELYVRTNDNLAPNPSFEEGSGDRPTGWTYAGPGTGEKFYWDSSDAYSGSKSVGISDIIHEWWLYYWCTYESELIPVDLIYNIYEVSVYYKYIGVPYEDQYAGFGISLYDINKEDLGFLIGTDLNFSTDWAYSEWFTDLITGWLAEDTKYVQLCLYQTSDNPFDGPNPDVEVRFDDIFFGIIESVSINIENIYGPFRVNAEIKNNGTGIATNVNWSINLDGGFIFQGGFSEGSISTLGAGASETIHLNSLFGIGTTTITVTAGDSSKQATGFMLGPLVLNVQEI